MSGPWRTFSRAWWVVPVAVGTMAAGLAAVSSPTRQETAVAAIERRAGEADLQRCRAQGDAASRDRDCLRIWREARDRFLGVRP